MSSAAAITNVNARFAFVLLIGFLLNFYCIKKAPQHNVDYVVWRNGSFALFHRDFGQIYKISGF